MHFLLGLFVVRMLIKLRNFISLSVALWYMLFCLIKALSCTKWIFIVVAFSKQQLFLMLWWDALCDNLCLILNNTAAVVVCVSESTRVSCHAESSLIIVLITVQTFQVHDPVADPEIWNRGCRVGGASPQKIFGKFMQKMHFYAQFLLVLRCIWLHPLNLPLSAS